MIARGYARLGPSEEGKLPSLQEQIDEIRRFCERNGLVLGQIYQDEVDADTSTLPGIFALTSELRQGWVVLVVTSADRIVPLDDGLLINELKGHGKHVIALDDHRRGQKLARLRDVHGGRRRKGTKRACSQLPTEDGKEEPKESRPV